MSDPQAAYVVGAIWASQAVYWSYRAFVCRLGGYPIAVIFLGALIVEFFYV